MYSNEKHLDQVITQFPGPQDILRQLCEQEKRKTNENIKNIVELSKAIKEDLVKEAMKFF